ncbi:hypothetical protein [Providencia phage vB_PreS-PatoteraRojo]|nr:hypothetical protein [Providencia phage vB_PreS-PatoteraRojo]
MRKDYQIFKNEYPLYIKEHAALCPSARIVGGVSGWLCECKKPLECAGVKQASAPILFTHSFYNHKNLAQFNDASDYIAEAVIVDANHKNDFKFCFWVSIKENLLLAVKPAQPLIDGWQEKHGGTIEAIQVKRNLQGTCTIDVSFRGDSAFGWNAIAGLAEVGDMVDLLTLKLRASGTDEKYISLAVNTLVKG